MSVSTKEREQFLISLTRLLPDVSPLAVQILARKLLRSAATLQRLSEAQCNGDWPADNGQRIVRECDVCQARWDPSTLTQMPFADDFKIACARYVCQDCRHRERVRNYLKFYSLKPWFQGDPRGPIITIHRQDVVDADIDCGRERGIVVPS